MRSRLALVTPVLCAVSFGLSVSASAQGGGGGGGGGGGNTIPNISGNWKGTYTATAPAFWAGFVRQINWFFTQKPGSGTVAVAGCAQPNCPSTNGQISADGRFQVANFKGAISGAILCLDGQRGTVISGTWKLPDLEKGVFSFNNCP